MAAELPVLVSRRCGCREDLLVEGDNGFSFEPEDAGGLTALLHRLEAMSDLQRKGMGERSGERIAAYTPRGFGRAIASISRSHDKAGKLHLLPEAAQ